MLKVLVSLDSTLPFLCIPDQCNPPHKHARNMHCFIQLAMAVRFVAWLTHVENDQTWTVLMLINSMRADKLTWWSNENDNFGVGFPGLVMQPSKRVCVHAQKKKKKDCHIIWSRHSVLWFAIFFMAESGCVYFLFCFFHTTNYDIKNYNKVNKTKIWTIKRWRQLFMTVLLMIIHRWRLWALNGGMCEYGTIKVSNLIWSRITSSKVRAQKLQLNLNSVKWHCFTWSNISVWLYLQQTPHVLPTVTNSVWCYCLQILIHFSFTRFISILSASLCEQLYSSDRSAEKGVKV